MLLAIVPAAPPTRKNQRATSCPAPISAKVPYLVLSRLIWTAFWCVSSRLSCIVPPLESAFRIASVPPRVDRPGGLFAQRLDDGPEHGEPRVPGRSPNVSRVDLLGDHGDLEQSEGVVKEQIRDVAACRPVRSARRPRAGSGCRAASSARRGSGGAAPDRRARSSSRGSFPGPSAGRRSWPFPSQGRRRSGSGRRDRAPGCRTYNRCGPAPHPTHTAGSRPARTRPAPGPAGRRSAHHGSGASSP